MGGILRKYRWYNEGKATFGSQAFDARSKQWDAEALSLDLTGRSYLVTGANAGIGFEVARALSSRGGVVHMICRSKERGENARKELSDACGDDSRLVLHLADLSSTAEAHRLCDEFLTNGTRLHALINNAGVLLQERMWTGEGNDAVLATNVLSGFILTERLRPLLVGTPPGRVISVSSGGLLLETVNVSDLQMKSRSYNGTVQYSRTKRMQADLTRHWAAQGPKVPLSDSSDAIVYFCMHPGWSATPGVAGSIPGFYNSRKNLFRSAEQGADTIVWLAIADEPIRDAESNGAFFLDRQVKATCLRGYEAMETSPENVQVLVEELKKLSENKAAESSA